MARIFLGLSGGVDSAVAGYLLQREGHEVIGVFIRGWHPEGAPCSEAEDRRDAMRVAAQLRIPFRTVDGRDRYERTVAAVLIEGYAAGEVPNPDALCNRELKFGLLEELAEAEGATVATGHYAQLTEGALFDAEDPAKNQSYFLALTPRTALRDARFPLGRLHKDEVRRIARRAGLPVAAKKDSQGVCFVGHLPMREFLAPRVAAVPGAVVSEDGTLLGEHDGAALYAIGARHGLRFAKSPERPLYVVGKSIARNELIVAEEAPQILSVFLREPNRFVDELPARLSLQYRHRGERIPCTVRDSGTRVEVIFDEPHSLSLAPGQIGALYSGSQLVCGGVMEEPRAHRAL